MFFFTCRPLFLVMVSANVISHHAFYLPRTTRRVPPVEKELCTRVYSFVVSPFVFLFLKLCCFRLFSFLNQLSNKGQILTKKKTKNNTITEKNVFLRQYIKLVSKQVMLTLSLPFILCVYLCVILSNVELHN